MSNYYVMIDGKQQGPFSSDEIIAKNLDPSTFIFSSGFDTWRKLADIPDLNYSLPINQNPQVAQTNPTGNPPYGTNVNSSNGMFQNVFSFEGRIRRTEYGISFIIYIFILTILNVASSANSEYSFLFLAYIPMLWFLWAQGAKRCHDLNNSGWFQIIPFYVLWLIFAEGKRGLNEYGISPK